MAADLYTRFASGALFPLHERLKVDIAESEYGRMTTLDGCVAVLRGKVAS